MLLQLRMWLIICKEEAFAGKIMRGNFPILWTFMQLCFCKVIVYRELAEKSGVEERSFLKYQNKALCKSFRSLASKKKTFNIKLDTLIKLDQK